jgi:hypothetical protein
MIGDPYAGVTGSGVGVFFRDVPMRKDSDGISAKSADFSI